MLSLIRFTLEKEGNLEISLNGVQAQQSRRILNLLANAELVRFDLDGESSLLISLRGVTSSFAAEILNLLVSLGCLAEEDIVETGEYEIDGERYRITKVEEEEEDETSVQPQVQPKDRPEAQPKDITTRKPKILPSIGKRARLPQQPTEEQIIRLLRKGPTTIYEVVKEIYGREGNSKSREYEKIYNFIRTHMSELVETKRVPGDKVLCYSLIEGKIIDKAKEVVEKPVIRKQDVTERVILESIKDMGKGTLRDVIKAVYGKDCPTVSYEYSKINALLTRLKKEEKLKADPTVVRGKKAFIYSINKTRKKKEEAEGPEEPEDTSYRYKTKHDIINTLKEEDPLTLDEIIKRVTGKVFADDSPPHRYFSNMIKKHVQKEHMFEIEHKGVVKYSLKKPKSFDDKKKAIRDLLMTGKFTVQEILENIFGKEYPSNSPEYQFLMTFLGELQEKGLLGMERRGAVRVYFIEGADQTEHWM